jgi:hypothetical protein
VRAGASCQFNLIIMSRVKIGISDLSPAELVLKGKHLVESMTGNANFTTPNPDLAVVDTALDDLSAATIAAFNRDKEKIAIRNQQAEEVKALIRQLSSYVQNVSAGDELIILSSGFEVRKSPEPVGIPVQVENLSAEGTKAAGELKLDWKAVKGASSYVIEIMDLGFGTSDSSSESPETDADDDTWEDPITVTASRKLLTGLNSGHIYRVRVAAVGSAGQGAWSDIAEDRTK